MTEIIKNFFNCDRGTRMTGDMRREQILHTAVELFSRNGFSGTTTKKIAEAAGVSEAMVFRHFASKDELYGAILHSKVCEGGEHQFPWEGNADLEAAMAAKDDHKVFHLLAVRALEKHQEDTGFMRLLFYAALEEHELAERFATEFIAKLYVFIGGYIEQRQKDGAMRNVNPRVAVRAFMGMLIHHSLNNMLWDKNRKLLNVTNDEAASNFADILLNGISK
ncbi:MAG: TetR/AcrR family transcriptional regulator [Pyrinomonadaceae bacterium]|nr:TetR/AcrR family transcriptional regulator [Pyrinomonadaceae bacterium]